MQRYRVQDRTSPLKAGVNGPRWQIFHINVGHFDGQGRILCTRMNTSAFECLCRQQKITAAECRGTTVVKPQRCIDWPAAVTSPPRVRDVEFTSWQYIAVGMWPEGVGRRMDTYLKGSGSWISIKHFRNAADGCCLSVDC
ncbi:Bifunctional protein GlmU [Trichinella spiralis]|uniref:Bifunctional protein GlmU n=1 Tax=Trichinella spiralis TaxID=6334 RepID=A0ABR3KIR5_TRISP